MAIEPLPGRSDPLQLQESLAHLRRYLGTARPDSLAVLGENWSQVIGRRLAAHCELHSLHHGRLIVSVADPAVAEQLRWTSNDLLGAANAVLGTEELVALDVRVRGDGGHDPDAPSGRRAG